MRDQMILGDSQDVLKTLPAESVHLTVTSCPYDDVFVYGGHEWSQDVWEAIIAELWRVTVPGGTVCWQTQDGVVDGRESGNCLRQALFFQEAGFGLRQRIVTPSYGMGRCFNANAYGKSPPEVFVFFKGSRQRCFNKLKDRRNGSAGQTVTWRMRGKDGLDRKLRTVVTKEFGYRNSVWVYRNHQTRSPHPARMNAGLARDLIRSYSRVGDIVLDPFSGSGTTCEQALLQHRRYLGIEVHEPYHDHAVERLRLAREAYLAKI
ncbi:DNA-methyltransferase [Singulisphaera rosea]